MVSDSARRFATRKLQHLRKEASGYVEDQQDLWQAASPFANAKLAAVRNFANQNHKQDAQRKIEVIDKKLPSKMRERPVQEAADCVVSRALVDRLVVNNLTKNLSATVDPGEVTRIGCSAARQRMQTGRGSMSRTAERYISTN